MNDFILSSSNSPANKLSPAKQALLEIVRTPVKNMGARRRILLSDSDNDIIEQMSHAAKAVEKSPILAKTIEAVLAEGQKPKRRGKGTKKAVGKSGEGSSNSGLGKRKAVDEVIMIMDDAPAKKKSKKEQQKAPGKGKNKKKAAKSSSESDSDDNVAPAKKNAKKEQQKEDKGKNKKKLAKSSSSESDSDSSEDSSNDDSSDSDTDDQKEIGHIILAKKAFVNLAQCGKCRDLQKTVVSVDGEGEEQAIQIVNCKSCLEGNVTMAKKFRKMFSIVKKDKKGKRRAEFDDGKLTYAKYQLCIGQCQNCATNQAAINAVAKGPTKKTKLLQVVNCNSCVKSNKKMNKLFWEKFSSGGGTTVGKKWEGGGQRFFNKRR